MRHPSTIATVLALCLLPASCAKDFCRRELLPEDPAAVRVELACEPLDFEAEGAKSTLSSVSPTKVTDVNYYLFDTSGALVGQDYFPDAADLAVSLPDLDATYRCYFFANVGRYTIPSGTRASDMGTAVHFDYGTYANYATMIGLAGSGKGFPMAGVAEAFSSRTSARVTVKRLVHTLLVKVDTDALNASSMTFTAVRVKQAARDVYPFAEGGSRATAVFGREDSDADALTAADIAALNAGGTATLYMLENMRGDLLPGNVLWKNKVPQNIPESERRLATYIELQASVTTPTADFDGNIYRAYLGRSASNFDVVRSTTFTLTSSFTNDMIPSEEWRVEAGSTTLTGTLEFVVPRNDPSSRLKTAIEYDYVNDPNAFQTYVNTPSCMIPSESVKAPSSFFLTDDFAQVFFIRRSNRNIRYDITVSQDKAVRPYLDYTVEQYDDTHDRITIFSTRKETYLDTVDELGFNYLSNGDVTGVMCNGTKPRKEYPVTITVTSADGLLSDSVTCRYFYGKQGIKFAKASTGYDEVTRMYSANLLKLNFSVDTFGRLGCFFNGYNGFCQLKRNADTDFLEYIGSPTRTDRYGSGSQEASTLRWTECVPVSNPGHANDIVSAWFPLGIGVIKVYVSGQTGTSNKFPASITYIPYQTKRKLVSPTLSGVDYYDRGIPSTSNYWGDYDAAVRYWSQTKSFQDAFRVAIEKTRLKVYDEDTRKTYTRYPCPFALEEHVDMFLGSYRLYSAGVHPAVKLSSIPGLVWTRWSGNLASPSSSEMYAYKDVVGNYICDQTSDSASSVVYSGQATDWNDNVKRWGIYGSRVYPDCYELDILDDPNTLNYSEARDGDGYFRFGMDPSYFSETMYYQPDKAYFPTVADCTSMAASDIEDTNRIMGAFMRALLHLPPEISVSRGTWLSGDAAKNYTRPMLKAKASDFCNALDISLAALKTYDGVSSSITANSTVEIECWEYLNTTTAHFAWRTLNEYTDYCGR